MNIAHWAAAHKRSILFLVTLIALGGAAAGLQLPVALFPHVNFPRVVVSLEAGDRPADQMVISVTRPLEEAVRSVPGVVGLRSTTSRGSAELSVNFKWGGDMVASMLQVESAINQALPTLPQGTSFTVRRMDPTVFPVTAYSLTSDSISLVDLRDFARFQLAPLLSSTNGVAKVTIMGGKAAEYRVEIDPARLNAFGLTLEDVAKSLSASNVLQAVGRLEDNYKLYMMLSDTRIWSLDEIRNTVLRTGKNGLVRLSDVAEVYQSTKPQWLRVTADGHDAVLMQIYQQPGGNTVKIVKEIQKKLDAYKDNIPKGANIANWYDQSQLIVSSAKSVRDAIIVGIFLAAFILFIFLRSLKITLIAILVVPSVLASAVLILMLDGLSFNIMTLGGMAAAVGLIVDDAIVMIEHIIRRLRENPDGELRATIKQAAIEFTPPLAGSSTATIIIFAPLAFLSGVTGAFFKALSITMAASLFISFLIALLAVPLLAEHLLSRKDAQKEENGPIFKHILVAYDALMHRVLRAPWLVLVALVPLVLIGGFAYTRVGSGFMPKMDEGGFILDYRADAGTSLSETDRLLRQVENILTSNPAVQTYSRRTGAALGGGLTEANEGDYFIRLKPFPRSPISQVMDEIRMQVETRVPGLEVEMALLMEDLIGDLTAVPQPIEIKLYGDNLDELMKTAPKISNSIGKISGVVDVKSGIVLAGDAINIVVDRDKAALMGIDPDEVTRQLDAWFNGLVTTTVQKNVKLIGVRIWSRGQDRNNVEQIDKLLLRNTAGTLFPLKRIATVTLDAGQPQIVRDNLKRMVAVTGRISGRDLGSTIRDVKKTLAKPGLLPKGMYYELGGLYRQQQIAFRGMVIVFLAALALVFVLLLYMYEEFMAAMAILSAPLLALSGVFTGLWLTGIELNITSMMGMTMIIGIVTEVSIFYFSEYHDIRDTTVDRRDSLVLAGRNRLRPIAMTTAAAMLALSPLALGIGQGSAMQQPLAVAIIAGLSIQLPLVLIVMPVLYHLLTRQTAISTRARRPK